MAPMLLRLGAVLDSTDASPPSPIRRGLSPPSTGSSLRRPAARPRTDGGLFRRPRGPGCCARRGCICHVVPPPFDLAAARAKLSSSTFSRRGARKASAASSCRSQLTDGLPGVEPSPSGGAEASPIEELRERGSLPRGSKLETVLPPVVSPPTSSPRASLEEAEETDPFVATPSVGLGIRRKQSQSPSSLAPLAAWTLLDASGPLRSCNEEDDAKALSARSTSERSPEPGTPQEAQTPRRNAKLKSPLKERMDRLGRRQRKFQKYSGSHLKRKSRERLLQRFKHLPEAEVEAIRQAFDFFDIDNSGTLDEVEAFECLQELGLSGINATEKATILQICSETTLQWAMSRGSIACVMDRERVRSDNSLLDYLRTPRHCTSYLGQGITQEAPGIQIDLVYFALEVVPKVRAALAQMRSQDLLMQFFKFDTVGRGTVNMSEAQEIARGMGIDSRMVAEMQQDMQQRRGHLRLFSRAGTQELASVDFAVFQDMIAKGREKRDRAIRERERNVKKFTGISDELFQEFRSDLVMLHDIFIRYDADSSGSLNHHEVMFMFKEFGLYPVGMNARMEVEDILGNTDADGNGEFCFQEFLELIREVRFYMKEKKRDEQLDQFKRYDKDHSDSLSMAEISVLLVDLGITPTTRREQQELAELIGRVDTDSNGKVGFEDFQDLCQRIAERLRLLRYEEDVDFALSHGFKEDVMRDLRWVFDSLDTDGSGRLDATEVRNGLRMLKKDVPRSTFEAHWQKLDSDGNGSLDFREFMQFMSFMKEGNNLFSEEERPITGAPNVMDVRILRRILERFRLSKAYLASLSDEEVRTSFCDYFNVGPKEDVASSLGVQNLGDLFRIALDLDRELEASNQPRCSL